MSSQHRYNSLAPLYDAVDLAEHVYKARLRLLLFENLHGRILDAGAGTGRSLPYYPADAQVVAADLSFGMLQRAKERGAAAGHPIGVVAMDLLRTGFPDATFDGITSAFTFCTLDEALQRPAIAEMARICKPGGELRILDYALSRRPVVRQAMQIYEIWEKAVWHGAFERRTESYLAPAGFTLVREESHVFDMVRLYVARRDDRAA